MRLTRRGQRLLYVGLLTMAVAIGWNIETLIGGWWR